MLNMLKNQAGNHLLYLLSEKKTLRWHDFKKYVEALYEKEVLEKDKYFILNLSRNLSSLGYIDIGKDGDNTIVKIAPSMLVALPFITPTFLLTGACCPELLYKMKKHFQHKVKIQNFLPDTIIIKLENIEGLEDQLQNIPFQGNKLSDYIKTCKIPVAWNILEFAGSLCEYKKCLEQELSGNSFDIKEVFGYKNVKI